jgi:hypothetical protein
MTIITLQQITFEQAKADESVRQQYLDQILLQCPESVERIIYDPRSKKLNEKIHNSIRETYPDSITRERELSKNIINPGAAVIFFNSWLGLGKKHPIFVSDPCFTIALHEGYILNMLVDHEAVHAKQMMHGINIGAITINKDNLDLMRESTIYNITEVLAYKNEMSMFPVRGISDLIYPFSAKAMLSHYESYLKTRLNIPKSDFERQVIEEVLNYGGQR